MPADSGAPSATPCGTTRRPASSAGSWGSQRKVRVHSFLLLVRSVASCVATHVHKDCFHQQCLLDPCTCCNYGVAIHVHMDAIMYLYICSANLKSHYVLSGITLLQTQYLLCVYVSVHQVQWLRSEVSLETASPLFCRTALTASGTRSLWTTAARRRPETRARALSQEWSALVSRTTEDLWT